ncbi:MAG: ACR3 family arsenite efflux transporter [Flavobacteriales bacterium]|nr:ACR3 family arsenite efflux transporter [Bacteroidota bacterium]MCB9239740.1 ACR3 family arsenite efflux transporter [Flavobacteriales bacterium]
MKEAKLGFFERWLSVWVALCIAAGVMLGHAFGDRIEVISQWELFGINIPVAILVWLMIFPMMAQIDFSSIGKSRDNLKGLTLTVVANWLIKPLTMAMISYFFFYVVFADMIAPKTAEEYLAGAILLGAAPCTAMVFVWSYLTRGNPRYTLIQVSVNDLILLVAFIPIVALLFNLFGIAIPTNAGTLGIPYDTLTASVIIFVVIPLLAGYLVRRLFIPSKGTTWYEEAFLPTLKPLSIGALLLTLILIFAFQGNTITRDPLAIVLIALPLTIQTYFIFAITWYAGKWFKLPPSVCAPSALIGASNFFELAVAVAIALFGLDSGASLATVVGVLIEVPVMLSLVWWINRTLRSKS